jgi:hypothetical protein
MRQLFHNEDEITPQIYFIREQRVMLDSDLALIYGVETRVLNQAVKRNLHRFPDDFMFQLTDDEIFNLKSQSVISSWGGRRKLPFAFTEHGAVMLASVLNSNIAIEASIIVVRAFIKLRRLTEFQKELEQKIKDLEIEVKDILSDHSEHIQYLFDSIKKLTMEQNLPRNPIGFKK